MENALLTVSTNLTRLIAVYIDPYTHFAIGYKKIKCIDHRKHIIYFMSYKVEKNIIFLKNLPTNIFLVSSRKPNSLFEA